MLQERFAFLGVLFLALLIGCTQTLGSTLDNVIETEPDEAKLLNQRENIASWEARRLISKILQQMPCGWPEYDIPPLAPYKNENLTFNSDNEYVKALVHFQPIRIEGFDNIEVNELLVTLIKHKIHFDFNFPHIIASGKFDFAWLLELLRDLGVHNALKGAGLLDFGLENLRVNGTLRYEVPWIVGSARIYDLDFTLSLGAVHSNLSGKINGSSINKNMNRKIEKMIMNQLENYDFVLSTLLEKVVEAQLNQSLSCKKMWQLIWWALSSSGGKCKPTQQINMPNEY